MEFKYKTVFSGKITKVFNDEFEKLVVASNLDALKSLMPAGIDLKKNLDLIGCVFNGAVAGRMNANGDSIDNKTAIEINKFFLYKGFDLGHFRDKIIGVICNTGFSKFGENSLISEQEASEMKEPFNMAYAALIYKTILPENLLEKIESAADESSKDYGSLSTSWELFYNDYDIAVGTKNINECEIISEPEEKEKLEKYLLCNGGSGKKDGKYVFRVIKGDFLIPAGMGLVENPAADVKGIALVTHEQETLEIDKASKNESEISTIEEKSVISNKEPMKITSIKDLTDENLKECQASTISELFDTEIKKANEKWLEEKSAKENQVKDLEAKNTTLASEQETLKKQVEELTKKLNEMVSANEAKEQEEKFQTRMLSLSEEYELDDETRAVIVADIKGMNDEQFEAYAKKMKVLMKSKKCKTKGKAECGPDGKEEEMMEEEGKKKACKAAIAETTPAPAPAPAAPVTPNPDVIANAIANATPSAPVPPNTLTPTPIVNKYKDAFNFESCTVKPRR